MPREVYRDTDDEYDVVMEWERELVVVPVALERGQFTSITPGKKGEKFCKAHFPFQGVSFLKSVPPESRRNPCDLVREALDKLQDFTFSGDRLTPIRLGKLISRED